MSQDHRPACVTRAGPAWEPLPSATGGPGPSWTLPTPSPSRLQGEWFVPGLAGSTHEPEDTSLLSPSTATVSLNENNLLEVAYAVIRCVRTRDLYPQGRLGGGGQALRSCGAQPGLDREGCCKCAAGPAAAVFVMVGGQRCRV